MLLSVLLLAVCLEVSSAAAQGGGCGSMQGRDVDIQVTPGSGASEVALDTPVIVRYVTEVDLDELEAGLGEGESLLSLLRVDEAESVTRFVPGRLQRIDDATLAFIPDQPLDEETDYKPLIAKPNFDGSSLTDDFIFTTGEEVDQEPPTFNLTADEVLLSSNPLSIDCDEPEGSFLVGLAFPPAEDDADEGGMEYLLYLSRAAGIDGPRLEDRQRHHTGTMNMSFILSPEQVQEPVCVVIRVVDGVGKTAEGDAELCFDPVQGNFFEPGCSVVPAPGSVPVSARGRAALFLIAFVSMLLPWWRRGRGVHRWRLGD